MKKRKLKRRRKKDEKNEKGKEERERERKKERKKERKTTGERKTKYNDELERTTTGTNYEGAFWPFLRKSIELCVDNNYSYSSHHRMSINSRQHVEKLCLLCVDVCLLCVDV